MHKAQIRKEFKEFHKKLWPGMKQYPGGAMIYNIARHSRARSSRKKLDQLDTWISIYDEYTSWIHSVSISLQDPLKNDRYNEKLYLNRSLLILSIRIFSDLLAIRSLCLDGFDVQAKNILRSTVENIDLFCAIVIDPNISEKFCDTSDPVKSNEFWHKFVSKGKLGKFQIEKVSSMLKDRKAAESLIKMMYKYNEVLGAASHPCFFASQFSALSIGSGTEDSWPGYFGDRANISCDTLYHAILHIWKLAFYFNLPFGDGVKDLIGVEFDQENPFHAHAKYGCQALQSFMMFRIWNEKFNRDLFAEYDVSNIWPSTETPTGTT